MFGFAHRIRRWDSIRKTERSFVMDDFATGYLAGQDGGNNNGGFFGNEGLWAVIILAIIFGWGTNGYGRNGGDNGMNAYIPYLVGTGATGQGGNDTRAALPAPYERP